MASSKSKNYEYQSLTPSSKKDTARNKSYSSVAPRKNVSENNITVTETFSADDAFSEKENENNPAAAASENNAPVENPEVPYSVEQKLNKERKKLSQGQKLLSSDNWIARNGHNITFLGVYLFTFFVFFRPYELIPGLDFLSSGAYIIALATLLIYLPTQLTTEGNLTVLSTEVKAIAAMTLIAFLTIPIAKDPATAWTIFNDTYIKAVLMFIVMANVVRTRARLTALLWLSFLITVYMSYMAIDLYLKGEFKTEGYRVSVDLQGLFNNPNDMALHLTTMTPIIIVLGLATKSKILRWVYFSCGALFIFANVVTFSRGGFLGLIVSGIVLMWKLGRNQRLKFTVISIVVGGLFILLAPGNYGLRLLSIFIPGLDPVGSADMRRESLILSLLVTLRNPWGIGIGNFPIVGIHSHESHNAYTQVSSEIGLLGLAAYLIFMLSPFRKLGAIERALFAEEEYDWFYYLSIGLQASLVGYLVSSFFGSVAYNWFIYYLIAYAVAFRRIYSLEHKIEETKKDAFGWQAI